MTGDSLRWATAPTQDEDVLICDCGAEDWQAKLDPPRAVKWECRDCGAVYDADGRRIRDGR